MAQHVVDVRRFHAPLAEAGLVPPNCRLLEMSIGPSGGFILRYEVFLSPKELLVLGDIFLTVGHQLIADAPAPPKD